MFSKEVRRGGQCSRKNVKEENNIKNEIGIGLQQATLLTGLNAGDILIKPSMHDINNNSNYIKTLV